jgi:subtilisin family serine protease
MGATFAADMLASPQSPGLAAMAFYERAGLVKRVTPVARGLSRVFETAGGAGPMVFSGAGATAALTLAAAVEPRQRLDDGLSLVEMGRDEDVPKLQLALASDPNVISVSRVPVRYMCVQVPRRRVAPRASSSLPIGPAAVPPSPSTMWNLQKIKWAEARALSDFADAGEVSVAVLDSGIDGSHPDLQGRVTKYIWAHPDLPEASSMKDIIGHGTHVSGTIGADFNNNLGINGICACRIHSWKIFDDVPDLYGTTYVYFVDPVMYLRALIECASERMDVVNLSIGGEGGPSAPEAQAFRDLIANGTVVVAAMGNHRQQGSRPSYPAAIPGVIAVGATGITDKVATFSNRGNHISICAPGEAIWSTLPTYPGQFGFEVETDTTGKYHQGKPQRRDVDYDAWPGTSMATPHVAAAAALYIAKKGRVGSAAVRQALIETADKVPDMGGQDFHPDYGYGRLNLLNLLQ